MIKKIIALKDKKSGFTNVFLDINEGTAVRGFGMQCRQETPGQVNVLKEFPDDYALFCLGEIDMETGKIETFKLPKCIAEATQYAEKKE